MCVMSSFYLKDKKIACDNENAVKFSKESHFHPLNTMSNLYARVTEYNVIRNILKFDYILYFYTWYVMVMTEVLREINHTFVLWRLRGTDLACD